MDQANESLADRLRSAALERTTEEERVDDFVLDKDGVLDLRELERDSLGSSVADPARALATIRGRLGDAHEVSDLYDESEPEPPRWRLGLRARAGTGTGIGTEARVPPAKEPVAPPAAVIAPHPVLTRLSRVPLANEAAGTPGSPAEDEPVVADTGVFEARRVPEGDETDIDLRDDGRPTATCPKCMGLGHRDLFDRFSQVEFYSCDNCMHMWQQDRA